MPQVEKKRLEKLGLQSRLRNSTLNGILPTKSRKATLHIEARHKRLTLGQFDKHIAKPA